MCHARQCQALVSRLPWQQGKNNTAQGEANYSLDRLTVPTVLAGYLDEGDKVKFVLYITALKTSCS